MKLDRLTDPGKGANSQSTGAAFYADERANEKIAPLECVQIFIGGQANEEIALRSLLNFVRQTFKWFY